MVATVRLNRFAAGTMCAAILTSCIPPPIPEPDAGPAATAIETPASVAADGSIGAFGLRFRLPDDFEITESLEGAAAFSAARLGDDIAGLHIWPCPHCSGRTMKSDGAPSEIQIDGYSVITTYSTTNGPPTYELLILADEDSVMARLMGYEIDAAWQEFVDSIELTF